MMKKYMAVAAVLSLTMALAAGCGSEQAHATESGANLIVDQSEEAAPEDTTQQAQDGGTGETQSEETQSGETEINAGQSQEAIWIGGRVRSVSEDSFVLSRTLLDDSCVIMPEEGSPEEELVTVLCPDSVTFELQIIQGGGADIKTLDAEFSDIKKGTVLEAYGFFDGEEFLPERVCIEIEE